MHSAFVFFEINKEMESVLFKSAIPRIETLAIFLTRETKQEKNGKQPRGNNEKETWTQVICIHWIEKFIQRRSKVLLLLAPGSIVSI